jgi:uncharacterized protein (UPF0332 family)
MKPQAAAFLEKARAFLDKAQGLLDAHHWPDEAGRAAYLAGLHAAQALIFENTGKVIKRHSGVQREFARLVKDEPRFDVELRAFLPRTYNLKAIADYVPAPVPKCRRRARAKPSRPRAGSWIASRLLFRRTTVSDDLEEIPTKNLVTQPCPAACLYLSLMPIAETHEGSN